MRTPYSFASSAINAWGKSLSPFGSNGAAWAHPIWRWILPKHSVQSWTLHHRLSRAGSIELYHSRMVSLVCSFILYGCSHWLISRCTAHHSDLDGNGGHHSHVLTEALYDMFDAKALWDEYGIVEGVMMSRYCLIQQWYWSQTESHSLTIFLMQIFMSCYPLTFSIKSSREPSKIILLPGSKNTSTRNTVRRRWRKC